MFRAVNISMGVRLALIDGGGRAALVFESARAARRKSAPMDTLKSAALPRDAVRDVTVKELPITNTLLASAVSQKKARFVKDCASYMQNCPTPARDVFTHATELVSSVVVVPLLVGDNVLGAVYFTQDAPCDFSNIQDALLGFVHAVTLALHNKLAGQMGMMRSMLLMAGSKTRTPEAVDSGSALIRQLDSSDSEGASDRAAGDAAAAGGGGLNLDVLSAEDAVPVLAGASVSASGRLSKVSSRRLCTEAMLKVLQQEIRKGKRRSVELSFVADHLVIAEPIGRGGFGRVFRGSWHKRPAAIKVMNARESDSEAVSDAMEMAVLSTVNHPNIVQVYSCLTDMVEAPALGAFGGPDMAAPRDGAPRMPRYRRLAAGEYEEHAGPTYNIVVMEYMDKGTLGEQVRKAGMFHRRMADGSIGVDLAALLDILLDIANSLQYLHSISLLHGDIKLDNVLLKSDPLRPMGFMPKLADFGLSKMLRESDQVINHTGAGTVTHLAPEMFTAGSQLTTAVDVYALGVLMWEFYTAKRPWQGLTPEAIMDRVLRRGGRPTFPAGAPPGYAALAAECWAPRPADRPALGEVVARLAEMADSLAAPSPPPPPATPPAAAAAAPAAAAAAGARGGAAPALVPAAQRAAP
ncbi:MAG: kinase-like domain-containing protein [Monoraphidium minutum]|nr:MAG: kinase-like domain-containing protein [Monoraphidium minutum]